MYKLGAPEEVWGRDDPLCPFVVSADEPSPDWGASVGESPLSSDSGLPLTVGNRVIGERDGNIITGSERRTVGGAVDRVGGVREGKRVGNRVDDGVGDTVEGGTVGISVGVPVGESVGRKVGHFVVGAPVGGSVGMTKIPKDRKLSWNSSAASILGKDTRNRYSTPACASHSNDPPREMSPTQVITSPMRCCTPSVHPRVVLA